MVRQGGPAKGKQKGSVNLVRLPQPLTTSAFATLWKSSDNGLCAYKTFSILNDVTAPLDPESHYVLQWCATADTALLRKALADNPYCGKRLIVFGPRIHLFGKRNRNAEYAIRCVIPRLQSTMYLEICLKYRHVAATIATYSKRSIAARQTHDTDALAHPAL